MFIVDRLNSLLIFYGYLPLHHLDYLDGRRGRRPAHAVLNRLDKAAKTETYGQVGARLARHESLARGLAPPGQHVVCC